MTIRETDAAYFTFLDELRESGETNMYGAGSYLMDAFPDLGKAEARTITMAWMKSKR